MLIDNTGGARAELVRLHDVPRIRWADGTDQGESPDILKAMDEGPWPPTSTLPASSARSAIYSPPPSVQTSGAAIASTSALLALSYWVSTTRGYLRYAAFLFRSSGQPVARRDFEATLEKTDALLGERGGPFFVGESPTAPDVCWAPFLERYAAQLPLLHDGQGRATKRAILI